MTVEAETTKLQADPPSDSNNGDSGKVKGKVFTEDELEAIVAKRLRGQGKALEERDKRLALLEAAETKRKEAELSEVERRTAAEKRAAEAEERAKALETREQVRLDKLAERNEERRKALPKELRGFPFSSDPDQQAEQLAALESSVETKTISVNGGAGRSSAASQTPEQKAADFTNKAMAALLGKK